MRKIKKINKKRKVIREESEFSVIKRDELYELDDGSFLKGIDLKTGMRIKNQYGKFITIETLEDVTDNNINEIKERLKNQLIKNMTKDNIIKAGDLQPGMELRTADGQLIEIERIEEIDLEEPIPVYNIEVADNHNYFVGENKVLVHNKALYSSEVRDTEVISPELLKKIEERRNVVLAKKGSDDYRYMETYNIDGSAGGIDNLNILLREDPAKLTAIEEFLHETQRKYAKGNKIPIIPSADSKQTYEIAVEFHVRDFMYKHKNIFG